MRRDEIGPHPSEMVIKHWGFTESMKEDNILVLHKKAKEPLRCKSYRPVCLLSSGSK